MPTEAFKETEKFNLEYCRGYDSVLIRPVTIQDLVNRLVLKTGCQHFRLIRLKEEWCPSEKPRRVKFATVNHRQVVSTEVVEKDMLEHKVRPATLKELLFFFLEHSDMYKGRELAALGTKKVGSMIEKRSTDNFVFYINTACIAVCDKNTRALWPTHVDFLGVIEEEVIEG